MVDSTKGYIFIIMVLMLNILTILLVVRGEEYELGFENNTVIEWEITVFNSTVLDSIEEVDFDDFEGITEIKWEIFSIDLKSDYDGNLQYWRISFSRYVDNDYDNDYYTDVAKDVEIWEEEFSTWIRIGDSYSFSIRVIPLELNQYLKEFKEQYPSTYQQYYTVEDKTLIEDGKEENVRTVIRYNKYGMCENMSVSYLNNVGFELILTDFELGEEFNYIPIIIIGVIIGIGVISIIIVMVVRSSKNPELKTDYKLKERLLKEVGESIPSERGKFTVVEYIIKQIKKRGGEPPYTVNRFENSFKIQCKTAGYGLLSFNFPIEEIQEDISNIKVSRERGDIVNKKFLSDETDLNEDSKSSQVFQEENEGIKYCSNCGKKLEKGEKVCKECNSSLFDD